MGSNKDDADTLGATDASQCESSGIEDLVGPVAVKMRCSLPQARLSLDAVFEAIREAPKPLRINGLGVFELRRFKCR